MVKTNLIPEYIFEVSWEVCNKVGGIHTVLSTKALSLMTEIKDNLILIGPDVWRENSYDNPEFIEDYDLFKAWKISALEEGINVRVGRWNIAGKPIAVLVDFTSLFSKKDEIFKLLWEKYKLDSLSGQWDYIEPALFGYTAGMVINSFTKFYLNTNNKIVAQFHEWMTGAGIFYLKENAPYIATAFTTHATAVGRSIAGNGKPLYKDLELYKGNEISKEFNINAKYSLEHLSAINADVFTTVSDITAKECKYLLGKEVDIVTPNGFNDSFVPEDNVFEQSRKEARKSLINVASKLLNKNISEDALLVVNSGRYEFSNKGIDVFIDALAQLKDKELKKDIIAYIMVPANNYGARRDLKEKIETNSDNKISSCFLTHELHDKDFDPVLNKIKQYGINNNFEDKLNIIFVPCYLNGQDGIFNKPYYDLLIGFDLTVFPSYYEPWGYTPLESVAFHIPTITTSLAGFGLWVKNNYKVNFNSVMLVDRNDENITEVTKEISNKILEFANKNDYSNERKEAFEVSRIALWDNFVDYYYKAYEIALKKVEERSHLFINYKENISIALPDINVPHWRKFEIKSQVPNELKGLNELSMNLWWTWNYEAVDLFKNIDKELWLKHEENPISFLKEITNEKFNELLNDKEFIEKYNLVYTKFKNYIAEKANAKPPKIAYFSMEFGFHDSLKIFSGGLGILAGDYLKEASDTNTDIIGIGLLYKYGYFKQVISINGEQLDSYQAQIYQNMPITAVRDENGKRKIVTIKFPGSTLYARIWEVNVGRIKLYLLDTDYADNIPQNRTITHNLYGGDNENRIKQEMLLGIGGIRALQEIGAKPDLYHCNEGHAAFIGLERIKLLSEKRSLTFNESLEMIRSRTLFTTHTPVPAGHDVFPEELMRVYMGHYPDRFKITWDEFMLLGKTKPTDEKFSMSILASNISQEINGVSMLHGEVSKEILSDMWKGYLPDESHVGYVTNGVHYPSWTDKEWRKLYENNFGGDFLSNQSDLNYWDKIRNVDDKTIWELKQKKRKEFIEFLREYVKNKWVSRYEKPSLMLEVLEALDENALTIGFARRFATYKRAHLLFNDIDRLKEIINSPKQPVQFFFAGKAHPNDKAGQDLIKHIIYLSKQPDFIGKILFLDDYNISLAKEMVKGVDIWLNTPLRLMEASGTSGMKAVMNGTLHMSVLDGWWVEGYRKDAGWMLPLENTYDNDEFQNSLDAGNIYNLFEEEIIPDFYSRDANGVPKKWVSYIKNSIASVAPVFTTKRMIDDYKEKFYYNQFDRSVKLKDDNYKKVIEISNWKKRVSRNFADIKLISFDSNHFNKKHLETSDILTSEIVLDMGFLQSNDIGVELVLANDENGKLKVKETIDFNLIKTEGRLNTFKLEFNLKYQGIYDIAFRIYAKNNDLPYRQDFAYVKWIEV